MILVAGSANLDFVVRAKTIPAPGETVLGSNFQTFPGGKGANQAIACARAGGATTAMLLALGSDAFAAPLEASLRDAGVLMHIRRQDNLPTGTAFICVSDDGENAITVAPGANSALLPGDLPDLQGVSHLVLQLETPLATVTAYAMAARAQGVQVVLNAAPAQSLPDELLHHIDILVVNEGELAVVSGLDGNVKQNLERINVPCVVVTLGSNGSLARVRGSGPRDTDSLVKAAPFPVHPVDTTAAGDTFVGSFVAALARGSRLETALKWGNAAGALACLKPGAQSSIPTVAEVAAMIQSAGRASAFSPLAP